MTTRAHDSPHKDVAILSAREAAKDLVCTSRVLLRRRANLTANLRTPSSGILPNSCIGPDLGVKYNMLWYPLDRRYIREYCAIP